MFSAIMRLEAEQILHFDRIGALLEGLKKFPWLNDYELGKIADSLLDLMAHTGLLFGFYPYLCMVS